MGQMQIMENTGSEDTILREQADRLEPFIHQVSFPVFFLRQSRTIAFLFCSGFLAPNHKIVTYEFFLFF